MSVDRSLKNRNALLRHRNVLTRDERLEILADEDRWQEGQSVYGLTKVAHRKSAAGKKTKKAKEVETAEEAAVPAAETTPDQKE